MVVADQIWVVENKAAVAVDTDFVVGPDFIRVFTWRGFFHDNRVGLAVFEVHAAAVGLEAFHVVVGVEFFDRAHLALVLDPLLVGVCA